jgi:hypothetical protein
MRSVTGIMFVVVLLVSACSASASIVIHDGQPGIVAMRDWDVLDSGGSVWSVEPTGVWTRTPQYDPPVPVDQIKFWDGQSLVTTGNVAWRWSNGWINLGAWPGPPALNEPTAGAMSVPPTTIPNPSTGSCRVAFQSAAVGPVSVQVFDASGRLVRDLLSGDYPAGEYAPIWDGRDDAGQESPAGVYLAKVTTSIGPRATKLVLAR